MRVMLIHGAGASPLYWRTLQDHTVMETETFSYDVTTTALSDIVRACSLEIKERGCDAVMGHSFGGVVAWHVARGGGITRGISVSSPWSGSALCDIVNVVTTGYSSNKFFANLGRESAHLSAPRVRPVEIPWLNVVTRRNPFYSFPANDGVLTVRSQESIKPSDLLTSAELEYGHSEVLLSDELIALAESFLGC